MARPRVAVEEPEGLLYEPELLSEAEEATAVAAFDQLDFAEVRMRGQAARRTVAHFGYRYDYESWGVNPDCAAAGVAGMAAGARGSLRRRRP